jgi:hypothetical protein
MDCEKYLYFEGVKNDAMWHPENGGLRPTSTK